MFHFSRLIRGVFLILLISPASAQPSFDCNGQLNRAERAICGSQKLSALDQKLADAYRTKYRALENEGAKRRLRNRQKVWLDWRNTCGKGRKCLTRRYEERLRDLNPGTTPHVSIVGTGSSQATTGTLTTGQGQALRVLDRGIKNGRFEVRLSDGRVKWQNLSDGKRGTDFPDGSTVWETRIQVQSDPLPPLPDAYNQWGLQVELNQLRIVDRLLPEADREPYRDLFADEDFPTRIISHLTVIEHLVGE